MIVKTRRRHVPGLITITQTKGSTSDPERFSFCTVSPNCDCGLPYKRGA